MGGWGRSLTPHTPHTPHTPLPPSAYTMREKSGIKGSQRGLLPWR
ncbi:hypothetical protein [Nostoc sp.]